MKTRKKISWALYAVFFVSLFGGMLFQLSHWKLTIVILGSNILYHFWSYNKDLAEQQVDPLTPEEWKRVNTIQALREGTLTLSVGKRKKLAHKMVEKPLRERKPDDRIRIDQNGEFIKSPWSIDRKLCEAMDSKHKEKAESWPETSLRAELSAIDALYAAQICSTNVILSRRRR